MVASSQLSVLLISLGVLSFVFFGVVTTTGLYLLVEQRFELRGEDIALGVVFLDELDLSFE